LPVVVVLPVPLTPTTSDRGEPRTGDAAPLVGDTHGDDEHQPDDDREDDGHGNDGGEHDKTFRRGSADFSLARHPEECTTPRRRLVAVVAKSL
jgi:hypothetical protein